MPNRSGRSTRRWWEPVEARAVAEDPRVEQPRRRGEREGERDHGEGEPASAQHGETDDRSDRGPREPGADQAEREVPAEPSRDRRAGCRPDGDERHLPEADLAGPAREDDERQRDHAVDHRDRGQVGATLGEGRRDERERQRDEPEERGTGDADLGQAGQLAWYGPRLADGPPGRRLEPAAQPGPCRCEPHRDQHDDEEHGLHVGGLVPAPDHRLLHDAERDGGQRDRRQALHPADDRGGQRREEEGRSEHGPDREPDDAGTQEHGEERHHRRQHPHDAVHAAHGDAYERGAVGVVGACPHRRAETRPQEQGQAEEGERDGDERDHVVAAEAQWLDGERHVERGGKALRRQTDVEPPREEEPQPGEHLREPDGGDREDQTGRAEEPSDDEQLDRGTQRECGHEAGDERDEPTRATADHEEDRQRCGRGTKVSLGEVEDAVGAVDERQAEREEGAEPTQQRALHDDPGRRSPQHLDQHEEAGCRPEAGGGPPERGLRGGEDGQVLKYGRAEPVDCCLWASDSAADAADPVTV